MVQLKFHKLGIALTNSTRDLNICGVYNHFASRKPNQTKQLIKANLPNLFNIMNSTEKIHIDDFTFYC